MDEDRSIVPAGWATDWELSAEIANSVDQSFGDIDGEVAHFDSHDVCYRCRNTPWIEGVPDKLNGVHIWRGHLAAVCPVCNLLRSRDREISDAFSDLTWRAGVQTSSIFRPGFEDSTGSQVHLRQVYRMDPLQYAYYLIRISKMGERITRSGYQYRDPPKVSFSQIREHIDICMKGHKSCSLEYFRPLVDLRVIDCEQRLVVDAPTDCRYITLSYVWGEQSGSEDFVLSRSLPPTIEHSILTTLKLGYKYLWIDRYCIDQQDQEDKSRQIMQMSTIYQRADLTIIAAAGNNPLYGLPGVQKPRPVLPLVDHRRVGSLCFSKVPEDKTIADIYMINIAESEWASRAWTYQEAAFSRRRLIFTDRQVIFNCNTRFCLESGITLPNQDLEFLSKLWTCREAVPEDLLVTSHISCMEQYCRRSLSKDSDALNAISSTLEAISERDYYHIWGVPVKCHSQDSVSNDESQPTVSNSVRASGPYDPEKTSMWLSWQHSENGGRRRPGFPSWSPLGWAKARISWSKSSHFTGAVSVRTPGGVESLSDHLLRDSRNPNEMSQLLVCRMKTAQGLIVNPNGKSFLLSIGKGFYIKGPVIWDRDDELFTTDDSLKIAIIDEPERSIPALLLIAVSDHYERIGHSTFYRSLLNDFTFFQPLYFQEGESSPTEVVPKTSFLDPAFFYADERLEATFGNLDSYKWWEHVFKEEYITLG